MRSGWGGWLVVVLSVSCGRSVLEDAAPVASLTPLEQTVRQGDFARWRGSADDASGAPVTFIWRVFSRPSNALSSMVATGPDARLKPDQPGDWVVELVVAADGRVSLPVVALLHVQPATVATNHAPVAHAGFGQSVMLGQPVTLDATGSSDPDGDRLTFSWSSLLVPATVVLSSTTSQTPSFTPTVPGRYSFELQVSDPLRASDTATVSIQVLPGDAGQPRPDAGTRDAGIDAGTRDAGPGPDVLDPGEIYIAGTLSEGACYRDAIAHVLTPNAASAGFECYFHEDTATVRPSDGRLIYSNFASGPLREYHCDACTVSGTNYPTNVLANDPVIPTPCPGAENFRSFLLTADSEVLHTCSQSWLAWRDSTGAAVHTDLSTNDPLLSLGANGWGISKTRIINWKTATQTPITGFPPSPGILAIRWAPPGAFFVALGGMTDELWKVTTAGVATRVGVYEPVPPNTARSFGARLDGAGHLFHEGRDTTQNFVDVIVRREVGAPSTVVYTELSNPLVKLHISSLVTGP